MTRWFVRVRSFTTTVALACAWSISFGMVPASGALRGTAMVGIPLTVAPETLFHTLATDFNVEPDGTIYVQTGDIPAMWLRDAAAQTLPYVRFAHVRPTLRGWIRGVIAREARNINRDPYANAFKENYAIWERKWEIDSLAYPVLLAWRYEKIEGDRAIFTPRFHRALERIVATYTCERHHARCSHYRFHARGESSERGAVRENGLIWSAFRASDDPTRYGYNIPEQLQAITALRDLAELATIGYRDRRLATRANAFAGDLERAVAREGIVYDFPCGGAIYAFEIDGLGHRLIADDANVPSLIATPLFDSVSIDDPVYRRTRACMLSARNPYYFHSSRTSGIGSPHTPRGFVWPLALIARALTSTRSEEIVAQLRALAASVGPSGLVHESFDPTDTRRFTRAEFGWGNAMYAELLFRAAAGFEAQPTSSPRGGFGRPLPASIAVVDRTTALANRAALVHAFERAVPLGVVGPDLGD